MKLLTAMLMPFALVASALAQTAQRGDSPAIHIARGGSQPASKAPPEHFTGSAHVNPLFQANDPSRTSGASVTFEPGARTAWHTHPLGQILIVTAGTGRVQREGGPVEDIRPGDVVRIPPGVKHWHGAAPGTAVTHIAIQEQLGGKTVDWLEPVSDEQYGTVPSAGAATQGQASRAQQLFGDIAPKLADLTDTVLFGDVWARPGLSRRDRSLATVSALIAMNRPDQLRSHLALARENGVTQEEAVEAITHLAFYTGWPSAVTAIAVAKEVFPKN